MMKKLLRRTQILGFMLLMLILAASVPASAAARISLSRLTMTAGSTYQLKMKGLSKAAQKKVKWSSSKKKIAKISKKGKVKALRAGKAVIRAKVGKKTYKCSLVVKAKIIQTTTTTTSPAVTRTTTTTTGTDRKTTTTTTTSASGKQTTTTTTTSDSGKKTTTTTTTAKPQKSTSSQVGEVTRTVKNSNKKDELTVASLGAGLSTEETAVLRTMLSFKTGYPEGKTYTNDVFYAWNGGIYRGGYGCAAFAFMLSDAAFGTNESIMHYNWDDIRVGDILRTDYDTHSVIVLQVTSSYVIVAEANYNKSVHWGRKISMSELKTSGSNIITRYNTTSYTIADVMKRARNLPVLMDKDWVYIR